MKQISKYQIAKELGVSHQAVYNWFNGKRKPSLENIIGLSKILKISFNQTITLLGHEK